MTLDQVIEMTSKSCSPINIKFYAPKKGSGFWNVSCRNENQTKVNLEYNKFRQNIENYFGLCMRNTTIYDKETFQRSAKRIVGSVWNLKSNWPSKSRMELDVLGRQLFWKNRIAWRKIFEPAQTQRIEAIVNVPKSDGTAMFCFNYQ